MKPTPPVRDYILKPIPPIRLEEIRKPEFCERCRATVHEARDDIHFCDETQCRFRAIERGKNK